MRAQVMIWHVKAIMTGRLWLSQKRHPRFKRSPPSFATVAGYTCCDNVFPAMRTSTPSGNNMIQGELLTFASAVLADITISTENLQFGQPARTLIMSDKIDKTDYRRNFKHCFNRMEATSSIF